MSGLRIVGPAPKCTGHRLSPCWCQGRRYTCPGCLRFVPYCIGGTDSLECDECWYAREQRVIRGLDR